MSMLPASATWTIITDTADQAVILPVVALVALVLLVCGAARTAVAWTVAVGGTLGGVLVGKIMVVACMKHIPAHWALHSPSGHTASAAIVAGGFGVLLAADRPRLSGLAAAGAAAAMVGASRLALGVHTSADVLAGASLGLVGTLALQTLHAALTRRHQYTRRPAFAALACAVSIAWLLHGQHLAVEDGISDSPMSLRARALCGSD